MQIMVRLGKFNSPVHFTDISGESNTTQSIAHQLAEDELLDRLAKCRSETLQRRKIQALIFIMVLEFL